MIAILRVGLAAAFVPIAILATFFASYAALYPAFWSNSISPAAKMFEAGTVVLALMMGTVLWSKGHLERHPLIAGALLAVGVTVVAVVVPETFVSSARF